MLKLGALALTTVVIATAAPAAKAATYLAAGPSSLCASNGCFSGATNNTYRQVFSAAGFSGAIDVGNLALDRNILGANQDLLFKVSFQLADGTKVGDWGSFMIAGLGGQVVTIGGKAFTWDTSQGDLVMTLNLVVPEKGGGGGGFFGGGGGGGGGGGVSTDLGEAVLGAPGGLGARPGVDPSRHLDSDEITGLMTSVSVVPEPAAWGLMLFGFGAAGAVVRGRRRYLSHG